MFWSMEGYQSQTGLCRPHTPNPWPPASSLQPPASRPYPSACSLKSNPPSLICSPSDQTGPHSKTGVRCWVVSPTVGSHGELSLPGGEAVWGESIREPGSRPPAWRSVRRVQQRGHPAVCLCLVLGTQTGKHSQARVGGQRSVCVCKIGRAHV